MRNPGKLWMPAEEAMLRAAWAEGGKPAALAALPDRSSSSVINKAHELGLSTGRNKYWKTVELRILKYAMWVGGKHLAARMLPGRSANSCGIKAALMGYRRRPGWEAEARHYVLDEKQVEAAIVARRQGMRIAHIARALGVSPPAVRRVVSGFEPMGVQQI